MVESGQTPHQRSGLPREGGEEGAAGGGGAENHHNRGRCARGAHEETRLRVHRACLRALTSLAWLRWRALETLLHTIPTATEESSLQAEETVVQPGHDPPSRGPTDISTAEVNQAVPQQTAMEPLPCTRFTPSKLLYTLLVLQRLLFINRQVQRGMLFSLNSRIVGYYGTPRSSLLLLSQRV